MSGPAARSAPGWKLTSGTPTFRKVLQAGRARVRNRRAGYGNPDFAPLEINREHLQRFLHEGGAAALFSTLTHEIGHVLGAWQGGAVTGQYAPYTDVDAGTWTGPNVVALHGGPAPFQDASDPKAWVEGERDPLTLEHDFAHSGVCASLMAYCGDGAASPPFLPQAIDFAFLADLGMTVVEETGRPETYGLAGWTDFSAFTLSVSRDLHISLADPQPYYHSGAAPWYALEVTDLLQAGSPRIRLPQHRRPRHVLPTGRFLRHGRLCGAA